LILLGLAAALIFVISRYLVLTDFTFANPTGSSIKMEEAMVNGLTVETSGGVTEDENEPTTN